MKIGLVGFPGAGKTTVFNAITGLSAETGMGAKAGKTNLGVVKVPDPRVDALARLYSPKEKGNPRELAALGRAKAQLDAERPLRAFEITDEEALMFSGFRFLSQKPKLVVLNVEEAEVTKPAAADLGQAVVLSAKVEQDIA